MSREKYSIVTCNVTSRQHYGLLVRAVESGESGYIDRSDIADGGIGEDEWPSEGVSLRCVVLGYTRDGRLRLSARPRDVSLSASGINVGEALRDWISVRDAGQSDAQRMTDFLQCTYATSVLRWALLDRPASANYQIARWALGFLSPEIKNNFMDE
jgi:hypothetical protein